MKVTVIHEKSSTEYDFATGVPLLNHVITISTLLKAKRQADDYIFFVPDQELYINEDTYAGLELEMGCTVELRLRPELKVPVVIEGLRDDKVRKKTLFDLRTMLLDEEFSEQFEDQGGVTELVNVVMEATGNTLSYALVSLSVALKGSSVEHIPEAMIRKVIEAVSGDDAMNNIVGASLAIIAEYVGRTHDDFDGVGTVVTLFMDVADAIGKVPYEQIVRQINSPDVKIQESALLCINAIALHLDGEARDMFIKDLQGLGIDTAVQEAMSGKEDLDLPVFKGEVYQLQCFKMAEYTVKYNTNYDDADAEHEASLVRLWDNVFPSEELEERISTQWKKLGFGGTDPANDFRATGLLGLDNLVYFSDQHTDTLRRIVTVQAERPERDYPVAAAGLNITAALVDCFKLGVEPMIGDVSNIHTILFDGDHAFEEIYRATFNVFDRLWDEFNASFMDFGKVTAIVKSQVAEILRTQRPPSIHKFERALVGFVQSLKDSGMSIDDRYAEVSSSAVSESAPIVAMREDMRAEMEDLVRQQRFLFMQKGGTFRMIESGKKGNETRYFRLNEDLTSIRFGAIPAGAMPGHYPLNNAVAIDNISEIVVGLACPEYSGGKKNNPQDVALSFSMVLKSPTANGESVGCVALSRRDFAFWSDGLRGLVGQPFENPETEADIDLLTDTTLRVALIDLSGGADVPNAPPRVPDLPPMDGADNFDDHFE